MHNLEAQLGRIESKLDDVRDRIHEVEIHVSRVAVTQSQQERELREAQAEIEELRRAHDRATGAVKLILLPGVLAALAAGYKILLTSG